MLKLKKETLTIAFPCERIDQYVYGRHVYVTIEIDHRRSEDAAKNAT